MDVMTVSLLGRFEGGDSGTVSREVTTVADRFGGDDEDETVEGDLSFDSGVYSM